MKLNYEINYEIKFCFLSETITTFASLMTQEMDWQYDSNAMIIDSNNSNVNCSTLEQSSSTGTDCY